MPVSACVCCFSFNRCVFNPMENGSSLEWQDIKRKGLIITGPFLPERKCHSVLVSWKCKSALLATVAMACLGTARSLRRTLKLLTSLTVGGWMRIYGPSSLTTGYSFDEDRVLAGSSRIFPFLPTVLLFFSFYLCQLLFHQLVDAESR